MVQMMPKRDQTLRSPAVTFALAPAAPEFATLDSEPMPDQLTVTNSAVRGDSRVTVAKPTAHLAWSPPHGA